jgi:hypothetical protein
MDVLVYALITNPQYHLPQIAPNGHYTSDDSNETGGGSEIVAYSISFTDGQVNLDVRPGASGVGCTEMVISNEGQATVDVDVSTSGPGVTISPGAVSVTLAPGGSITVPICALALTQSSYKNVQVTALAQGRETNTQLQAVNKNAGFAVIIQQYARLSVQAVTPFQRVCQDSALDVEFIAVNNGNYQDTIAVEVLNQHDLEDAGFTISLAAVQYLIDSQGHQPVKLSVITPDKIDPPPGNSSVYHTIVFQVATTLEGETEARSVTATLEITECSSDDGVIDNDEIDDGEIEGLAGFGIFAAIFSCLVIAFRRKL